VTGDPQTGLDQGPLIVRRDEDIVWAELNDPERANALSPAMIEKLTDLYRRDLRSQGVRALILSGAGRHFSAGADLEHLRALREADATAQRIDSRHLRDLFQAVLEQEVLTLALVQGACVAGGVGLATAHDFVVATREARFLYSEVRIGFVAALVATFLPLRVKGSDLRELLLNPEFIDSEKALAIGLANQVVEADDLRNEGRRLALSILERASSESIARTKRLLLRLLGRPLDDRLMIATEENASARTTEDCQRGISTFLETKKPPRWR